MPHLDASRKFSYKQIIIIIIRTSRNTYIGIKKFNKIILGGGNFTQIFERGKNVHPITQTLGENVYLPKYNINTNL